MEAVLDLPVASVQGGDFAGAGADGLGGGFSGLDHRSAADDAERLAASRQGREVVWASVEGKERAGSFLKVPVGLVEGVYRRGDVRRHLKL